jgi:hypothetical protein
MIARTFHQIFIFDLSGHTRTRALIKNFLAANPWISMQDNFNPKEASYGELDPADFAISTSLHYNL